MPTPPNLQQLQQLVATHLDVAPDMVQLTPISTGQFNSSFWAETRAGRFVLRLAPPEDVGLLFYEKRMMRQEPALHALIQGRTSIPVPTIRASDFSRQHIDRDYLLLQVLPGTPLSEANLSPKAFARTLEEIGDYLHQLHALKAPDCLGTEAFGYLGPHLPLPARTSWTQAFLAMWNALLDDVVACGAYREGEADGLREALLRNLHYFDREVVPSLLHMDVWGQNILVEGDGRVTGLIDFDRALWGDVEIEFAVLDYCGISEPAFWKGYGCQRNTSSSAQVRHRFYLLYELQKYMPIEIWRGHNLTAALNYKEQCLELAFPLLLP